MGFFTDLREDLNQAVSELLPVGEGTKEGAVPDSAADIPEAQEQASSMTEETVPEEPVQAAESGAAGEQAPATEEEMAELEQMLQNIEELRISEDEDAPRDPAEEQTEGDETAQGVDSAEVAHGEEADLQTPESGAADSEEESLQRSVEELQSTMAALQGSLGALKENAQEPAEGDNLERELRATFGAAEGEETAEELVKMEAIRKGAEIMDKSWVMDLSDFEPTDETAIITAGMRVNGDIVSNGSLDVIGEVQGNVQVRGKLNVTGKLLGNSKAEEIFADSARITGDVISDGSVKIGVGSVVIGSIEASSAAIAGAVKGNIDVMGPVILDTTAVVLGNIRAKSMQINNGARIEGMCVLCYAEQSAAKFFENQEEI